ncbi:MAG: hypothetical protein JSU70_03230 [Phycisphaerales bacterium]|nr:MAG: hypothetical protein JSU70_03230 [Phycisphaerales bacterium]
MRYVSPTLKAVLSILVFGPVRASEKAKGPVCSAYLMAYFGPEEKLFYATSEDTQRL